MTVLLTINGQNFDYPGPGPDEDWGPEATDWATAVSTGLLQKSGGLFTLLDEVDFGATYGLKSVYYKSRSSNIASAGLLRLARTDGILWRNEANDADLALGVDSSDRLTFNGTIIQQSLSVTDTATIDLTLAADVLSADIVAGSITNAMINASAAIAYSKLNLTGSIVNADVNAAAAIAYSKLALSNSIVNADINSSAAIAYSKLVLTGSIVNTDVSASAAIAYSKLNLSGSIVNADVNNTAAIAMTKLAALTGSRAVTTDPSGFLTSIAVTSTQVGYLFGVTSAIQTQIDSKVGASSFTAKGDLLAGTGSGTFAALTVGSNGTVLTADSAQATGFTWTAPLTNPMTTSQDIIVGGVSGAATRLAIGASNTVLRNSGGTLGYGLLVNANVDAAAAIAGSKINATAPTIQAFTSGSGTYTTPAGVKWIHVRIVGGGGGGSGSGTGTSGGSGGAGGNSTFGTSLLTCNGGSGATAAAGGGQGGSATMNSPAIGTATAGGWGSSSGGNGNVTWIGSSGAASPFGGQGGNNPATGAGRAAIANTGSGGGGAGIAAIANGSNGFGGGAGGYIACIIPSPSASYSYAIGAAGTAGTAGTSGFAGAAGGSGYIEVIEFYI